MSSLSDPSDIRIYGNATPSLDPCPAGPAGESHPAAAPQVHRGDIAAADHAAPAAPAGGTAAAAAAGGAGTS